MILTSVNLMIHHVLIQYLWMNVKDIAATSTLNMKNIKARERSIPSSPKGKTVNWLEIFFAPPPSKYILVHKIKIQLNMF